MDKLIDLYNYLLMNNDLKDKLVLSKEEFLVKEDLLLSGVGIIKNIINKVSVLESVCFINDYLKSVVSDLLVMDKYLINEYGQINGYIVYDILSFEYDKLQSNLKQILNIDR